MYLKYVTFVYACIMLVLLHYFLDGKPGLIVYLEQVKITTLIYVLVYFILLLREADQNNKHGRR